MVYLAENLSTRERVAIKQLKLSKDPHQMKKLITEITIMKHSQHPNIVNYVESYLLKGTLWVSASRSEFL